MFDGGILLLFGETTLNILKEANDGDLAFCYVSAFERSSGEDEVLFTPESGRGD